MRRRVRLILFLIIIGITIAFMGVPKVEAACQHEETEIETRGIKSHTLKCKTCKEIVATVPHDENMMIWEEYGNGHRYKCKECGKVLDEQPHNFADSWGFDGTYHWQKCKTCGAENIKDKAKHVPGENWYETGNKHYKTCKDCDMQLLLEEHTDKDSNGVCDICNLPFGNNEGKNTYCDKGCTSWHYTYGTSYECYATCEGEHVKWSIGNHSGTPTCTKKQTCTICGYMYWLEHDYVNGKCTMCSAVEPSTPTSTPTPTPTSTTTPTQITPTPTTTSTENWEKDVYYHWQVGGEKELHKPIPATCTQPISCICGAYVGKPKGHKYNDKDICTVCGAIKGSEPESLFPYEPESTSAPVEKNISFNDVNPGDWYYDNGSVKYVTDRGYIEENSSNNFAPDEDMTREKFIKMLYNVEGRPKVSQSDILEIYKEFNDIKDDHDLNAIVWGRKNNIMSGMSDGRFGTDDGISRQQMAVALKRYVEYRGEDTSKRADLTKFSDYKDVYDWAEEALSWAVASGIIKGSDGKLLPQANATRAQVATMIMNYLTK